MAHTAHLVGRSAGRQVQVGSVDEEAHADGAHDAQQDAHQVRYGLCQLFHSFFLLSRFECFVRLYRSVSVSSV